MCIQALIPLFTAGAGAATAAGATAAAATGATLASTLAGIGSVVSIGGSLLSGIQGARAANQQIAALESQKLTEAQLTAQKDQMERARMTSAIRQQTAELAARGVQLDSVTAVALGQTAARELSFQSQAIRSDGQATQTELSSQVQQAKALRTSSILKGAFSAAGDLITGAPDLWPGFFQEKVLA